jgi:hypothetical protein
MKDAFKFDTNFGTESPAPLHLGRMVLASGNVVRFLFTPDGLKLVIGASSLKNEDVFVTKELEDLLNTDYEDMK